MNTGSPSLTQAENSHSISEQCVFSVQECTSEGRERDRRNREESSSSGKQTLQMKSGEC